MLNTQVLPLVEVAGSHREMGRQFGEQVRDQVQEYSEMWLGKAIKRSGLNREQLLGQIVGFVRAIDEYAPQLGEEIRGVAEGSQISETEAFAIQVRMELLFAGPPQSCTTFALTGARTTTGQTIVGQNVDLDGEVERFGMILKARPDDAPAVLMYTSPGLVSYVGLNEAGVAVHGNLLMSPGWRAGFPRYLITRLMLEQASVDAAITAGLRPPRASSRNLILGDADGAIANVELTVDDARVLRSERGELIHTNHYLATDFCDVERLSASGSTVNRYEQMTNLLGTSDEAVSVAQLQSYFRDHHGYPGSICAHPREGSTSKTVASLISEPAAGRLHAARGNPCQSDYVVYSF